MEGEVLGLSEYQLGVAIEELGQRVGEQLDLMSTPIAEISERIDEGHAGGWLGQRRHLSLLDERERFQVAKSSP